MKLPRALAGVAAACALALAGCGSHRSSHLAPAPANTRHAASTVTQSAMGSVAPRGWGATPPGFTLAPNAAAPTGATREMLDTIDPAQLHGLHPAAVAGYLQGRWPDFLSLVHLFPAAHHVAVGVFDFPVYPTTARMVCLDVEPGDAVPAQSGPWARGELGLGVTPCLYSDLAEMPAVRASLAAAGVARSRVLLWLAWYRFRAGLVAGYDAVQWTDKAFGRNLDESTVTLAFLGVHAQPATVKCFTHRLSPAKCKAAKAKVASDQRAVAASRRALTGADRVLKANRCVKPYRRAICRREGRAAGVFGRRVRYFTAAAARVKAAS